MEVDPLGLERYEVESAIRAYKSEKDAARERGRRQREDREAYLRRQGYTEEQIKRR